MTSAQTSMPRRVCCNVSVLVVMLMQYDGNNGDGDAHDNASAHTDEI